MTCVERSQALWDTHEVSQLTNFVFGELLGPSMLDLLRFVMIGGGVLTQGWVVVYLCGKSLSKLYSSLFLRNPYIYNGYLESRQA